MLQHSNSWRAFRRFGAILSAFLLAFWAASGWCSVNFGDAFEFTMIEQGVISIVWLDTAKLPQGRKLFSVTRSPEEQAWVFHAPYVVGAPRFQWDYPHLDRSSEIQSALILPIWVPFVLLAGPTALLWWHDKRCLTPGLCRSCGYDLTGNVSGRCPECGTPTDGKKVD